MKVYILNVFDYNAYTSGSVDLGAFTTREQAEEYMAGWKATHAGEADIREVRLFAATTPARFADNDPRNRC